ncbi:thiamine-phosphate kinase [Dehalogenimonas sp. THU2]|uniref:thiamine-phosphate kinase n=1 Tax=Dehalogenimonas sp. THU2 TaxID=3151121 RepID=UPI0032181252
MSEFELIDRIISEVNRVKPGDWPSLLSGIGDDTALIKFKGKYQLATVDCLVEDVHFKKEFLDWTSLGWKALAVNLSDIAAMGGKPKYALVSLALPSDVDTDNVVKLYRGMLELARESGTVIAGGNISRAAQLGVHVTVIGEAESKSKTLLRSKAKKGDLIAVTGRLGGAAAGLQALQGAFRPGKFDTDELTRAFWRPQPRLDVGQLLVKHGVKCAIDISDGLLADLGHILKASKVGAKVEVARIPVHPSAASSSEVDALEAALNGGEDYELLFTGKREIIEKVAADACCPVTVIGEIVRGTGKIELLDTLGCPLSVDPAGWRHF